MTHYIFQVIIFQLLFLAVYLIALRNETFFNYNRMYLLGTAIASFVLPFLQFEIINEQIPTMIKMQLPTVFIGDAASEATSTTQALDPVFLTQASIDWSAVFMVVYAFGAVIASLLFVLKLRKLARFRKEGSLIQANGYRVCTVKNTDQAFTFFGTMYLGDKISEEEQKYIMAHEKIHIDQHHTIDLLFFELLKMAFWFNPMVYVYQNQIQTLHEFTADYAVAKEDKAAYYQKLLSRVFETTSISFINTFFNHSLIKKRIIMLQKTKSKRLVTLKYLVILPLLVGMLTYTSCETKSETTAPLAAQDDGETTEVMQKITELSEAIMKVGDLTDEESNALKLLTTGGQSGDKIYLSVEEYLKDSNEEGIPMAVIENVPTYPGCEGDNAEKKACFSKKITQFIVSNFNTSVGKDSNISGNQKIIVLFKINKIGIIQDVKVRAEHKELEREAKRVMNQLPKMKPGMQKGEAVNVMYSVPIMFKIED